MEFNYLKDGTLQFGVSCIPPNNEAAMISSGARAYIDAGNIPTPYAGPTAMELWKEAMDGSDHTMMPRRAEDHIEHDHGGTVGNPYLQTKYDDKKALRATKP